VGAELVIRGGELRYLWTVAIGMIVDSGGTTAVSDLGSHNLAGTGSPQRTIEKCRDSCATNMSRVRRDAKILPSPVLLVSWLTPSIAIDRSVVASPLLVR
jgi:hypothetical protein